MIWTKCIKLELSHFYFEIGLNFGKKKPIRQNMFRISAALRCFFQNAVLKFNQKMVRQWLQSGADLVGSGRPHLRDSTPCRPKIVPFLLF